VLVHHRSSPPILQDISALLFSPPSRSICTFFDVPPIFLVLFVPQVLCDED